MSKLKRLFWDIETSPNVVLSWRIGYKININHDNLLKERAIICIGYKWEGEKAVHALTWDQEQNDAGMLRAFASVADEADEMIHHNGDKFDLPWFKTRCLYHGIPTDPYSKTADTLQWALRKFYFNSNRLDYIAKYLGMGGKLKTEFGLWKEIVLSNDRAALGRMVTYCKRDVALLEKVWAKLQPHVRHKSHAALYVGGEKWHCPRCASKDVSHSKKRVTAGGTEQHQMQCKKCGGYHTINNRGYNLYLEANKPKEKAA